MNRNIVYAGAVPLDSDILYPQQQTMMALGALIQSTIGTGFFADGLACTQTTVASMSVSVAPGSIGTLTTVEPNAYGALGSDAVTPLMKMGINLQTTNLGPMAAPGTAGQSVVYLVQAAFSETDTTPIVLPYYNSSNPSVPYTGPSGSGASQNTRRIQTVTLQLKQGTATTTGSQTTPAPDSGFAPLWAITIANGATSIINANIAVVPNAPFIQFKLLSLRPGFSSAGSFGPGGSLGGVGTTVWTVPNFVTKVRVRLWGAGGGGGGTLASPSAAAGGGGGGYSEGVYSVTPGTTISVTAGAAGALGGAGTTNAGGTGGSSSFGAFCSATGGGQGLGASTGGYQATSGAFGTATGGNVLNINGTNGQAGVNLGSLGLGGGGGSAFSGSGSPPTVGTATSGSPVAGGGGGGANGGAGGVGGAGIVIVEW